MQERSGSQKCDRENDLITFLYGECNETEARNFEQHLRTCSVCESDLAGFNHVRKSMMAWRSDVLGVTETVKSSPIPTEPSGIRQISAVAAIREFFNLSPLWLKGAVAFASILFCLLAVLTIFNMRNPSEPSVASSDNKVYTEEELNRRVNEAVAAIQQQFDKERMAQGQNQSQPEQVAHPQRSPVSSDRVVASQNKRSQTRPLSRTERQQLAADLRLISSSDEPSLDLLADRINQQE